MSDDIIKEARDFFEEAKGHESEWRENWRSDLEFRALDQWDDSAVKARQGKGDEPARPMLTIDQTNQYVRQIVNDARMNPPALKALPMDDKGDVEVAEQLQGMFRYIEAVSRAQYAYSTALDWSVTCGRGFFRVHSVETDRARNFFEPRIGRIPNPLCVFFDPFSVEMDGSDATMAGLISTYSRASFKRKWPKARDTISWDGGAYDDWITAESVRVAEWHRIVERDEEHIVTPEGIILTEEMASRLNPADFRIEKRTRKVCEVRIITGVEVIDESEAHCDGVGFIPVYGDERYTEDKRDLRGALRPAKDAQKLLNFLASNMAEAASVAPRAPWLVPHAAVAGHEHLWDRANQLPLPYLPYNHLDENSAPLPPPSRLSNDMNLMGYMSAISGVQSMIQSSMGMYQASVGAPGSEKSGVAIRERKNESDVGTFHYNDNLAVSVQHGGRLIMQMIPRIFDTVRTQQILGEDGKQSQVQIDPMQPVPMREQSDQRGKKVLILNPNIGEYDIQVTVGASYTTKRQEAVSQMSDLLSRSPNLTELVGDLFVGMMDFPGAQVIAARMKLMLPPMIKAAEEAGADTPPEVVAMVEELKGLLEQREQGMTVTQEKLGQIAEQVTTAYNQMVKQSATLTMQRADMKVEQIQLEQTRAEVQTLVNGVLSPPMLTDQLPPGQQGLPMQEPAPMAAQPAQAPAIDPGLAAVLEQLMRGQEQTNALLAAMAQRLMGGMQPEQPMDERPPPEPMMADDGMGDPMAAGPDMGDPIAGQAGPL